MRNHFVILHDGVKSKLDNAIIVIAAVDANKVNLIASVSQEFTAAV